MKATTHEETNYGYAGELPEEAPVYDYETSVPVGMDVAPEEQQEPSPTVKGRRFGKNLLRRATAATLLTTSVLGSALGATEAAKGTERVTEGKAVVDIFTNEEALSAAHDIAYGYEKDTGGDFEIVDVEDHQQSPSELPASLHDRTRVAVTYRLTLSQPASRAIEAYDNAVDEEDLKFVWLQPSLNAHQLKPGSDGQSDILLHPGLKNDQGKIDLSDNDFHDMTATEVVLDSEKDSEGRHVYEVERYLYPVKGSADGNHEPIHIQLHSSTELSDKSDEPAGRFDSRIDSDQTIVMRDGTWQLEK